MSLKLFTCFSVPLMQFLTSNNIKYELVALNPNTKNTMWIYIKNEQLNKYLNQWSEANPNR